MSSKSLLQRWSTWLAMLAVVLHTLAPGMAQAMLEKSDLTHEVCSSTGIVRLAELTQDDSGSSGSATLGIHCEWCLLDLVTDLPSAVRLKLVQLTATGLNSVVPSAPAVTTPWCLAQPRAPPSFA